MVGSGTSCNHGWLPSIQQCSCFQHYPQSPVKLGVTSSGLLFPESAARSQVMTVSNGWIERNSYTKSVEQLHKECAIQLLAYSTDVVPLCFTLLSHIALLPRGMTLNYLSV